MIETFQKDNKKSIFDRRPALTWSQRIFHSFLLIIGWISFIISFNHFALSEPFGFVELYLLGCAIILPTLTGWWILHNLQYRNKNVRTHTRVVAESYEKDWDNYKIVADWVALKQAGKIRIDIDNATKEKKYSVGL